VERLLEGWMTRPANADSQEVKVFRLKNRGGVGIEFQHRKGEALRRDGGVLLAKKRGIERQGGSMQKLLNRRRDECERLQDLLESSAADMLAEVSRNS